MPPEFLKNINKETNKSKSEEDAKRIFDLDFQRLERDKQIHEENRNKMLEIVKEQIILAKNDKTNDNVGKLLDLYAYIVRS